MDFYQFAKDFAGPGATVLASIAAIFFAHRQVKVAAHQAATTRQQAQTALDQLRVNLFERRNAIYGKAQELIQMILNRSHEKDFTAFELAPYYMAFKEARFFFSDPVCQWLNALIGKDLKAAMETRIAPGSPEFFNALNTLKRRYEEMPDIFQSELEFSQLTQGRTLTGQRVSLSARLAAMMLGLNLQKQKIP